MSKLLSRFQGLLLRRTSIIEQLQPTSRATMSDKTGQASNTSHSPPKKQKTSEPRSEFVKEEIVAEGKWLSLNKITYKNPHGKLKTWESLARTTTSESGVDAVTILPLLRRTLKYDCVVCIKQYRPPMKGYTLEFPAGLIDPGESIEEAALRELREETGYVATVKHTSPPTCLDPGTENCTMSIVTAEIDGDDALNKRPEQQTDDTEFIDVIPIPLNDLLTRINEMAEEGVTVDARVYSYAVARAQLTKEKHLEPEEK